MKGAERFETRNYEVLSILFPLDILLIVRGKGKGKAIPVQTWQAMPFPGFRGSQI